MNAPALRRERADFKRSLVRGGSIGPCGKTARSDTTRFTHGAAHGKVLFFNLPFYGHVHPTLPLVAEMVQRGEQVIYYASETFRPAIEQAGATFRGIDACMTERTLVDKNLMRFAYTLIHATQAMLPAILPEVQTDPPDYILYSGIPKH